MYFGKLYYAGIFPFLTNKKEIKPRSNIFKIDSVVSTKLSPDSSFIELLGFLPILTPYFSQLFSISLMNKLNKIGDNGQSWRTPLLIGNSFDNIEANRARALDEV